MIIHFANWWFRMVKPNPFCTLTSLTMTQIFFSVEQVCTTVKVLCVRGHWHYSREDWHQKKYQVVHVGAAPSYKWAPQVLAGSWYSTIYKWCKFIVGAQHILYIKRFANLLIICVKFCQIRLKRTVLVMVLCLSITKIWEKDTHDKTNNNEKTILSRNNRIHAELLKNPKWRNHEKVFNGLKKYDLKKKSMMYFWTCSNSGSA